MKVFFQKLSVNISVLLYLLFMSVIIFLLMTRCLLKAERVDFCMADCICYVDSYSLMYLVPAWMIIFFVLLKEDFRTSVMVRYHKVRYIVLQILKKIIIIAIYLSITQLMLIFLYTIFHPIQFTSTWSIKTGYPFYLLGNIASEISLWKIILASFFSVLFIAAVVGIVIALFWWLTETPIIGYIIILIVLTYDSSSAVKQKVFFCIVSLDPVRVFLQGIQWNQIVAYPVVLVLLLSVVNAIIIKKHDFIKLV